MLPRALGDRLQDTRRTLERCSPAVASIRIRLGLQALATLIEPDRAVRRLIRLLSSACLRYQNCAVADRDQPRREMAKLIDRLEQTLTDARPSETAFRLGRNW